MNGLLFGVRFERRGMMIFMGRFASRISWSNSGRFMNGSRWFSGWWRWPDESDF